ncbi:MAG: PIN domain-containing protein [Acidobacteriota bacterium]
MIVGLDTSVIVRLLSGAPEELAATALRYLLDRRRAGDRILVSDIVLAEAYYALQHHYGVSKRDALEGFREFLTTSGVEATPEMKEVLATPNFESAKPGFIDRVIYCNYLRSGVERMATFEKAGAKMPEVVVLGAG